MKRSTPHRIAATVIGAAALFPTRRATVAAIVAALAVSAGCGGDDERPIPASQSAGAQTTDAMPTKQYVDDYTKIVQAVADARSAYFHGARSEERSQLRTMHRALTAGIEQLEAMEPPAKAADLHGRTLDLMRKRASQCEALLTEKPLDRERLSDLMADMDRDTMYDEIYSLPQ